MEAIGLVKVFISIRCSEGWNLASKWNPALMPPRNGSDFFSSRIHGIFSRKKCDGFQGCYFVIYRYRSFITVFGRDFCLVVLPSLKLNSLPMKNQWFIFMCFISSRKFPGLVPWMRDGLYGTTLPSPLDFCCSMLLAPRPRGFSSHRQSLVFQHHPGENTGRIRWKMRGTVWNDTVDGWNPVNSPVEVGSLSHYLQGFIHPRWLFGISSINSMYTPLSQLTCWSHQNGYCLGGVQCFPPFPL